MGLVDNTFTFIEFRKNFCYVNLSGTSQFIPQNMRTNSSFIAICEFQSIISIINNTKPTKSYDGKKAIIIIDLDNNFA